MLTPEERKKYLRELANKKKEILQVRNELNSINDKKEELFKSKDELSAKISSFIHDITHARSQRNILTREVKKEKQERDKFNLGVKDAVEEIKKLKKERDELLKKHNIKDPTYLLKQISSLETKIETEPMSFDKEKKIMVKIKLLKKNVKEMEVVTGIIHKIEELSKKNR